MNTPLLSICIPSYNRSVFLDVCLASLARISQKYLQQVEIVVSDNASTDSTAEVVEKYLPILPLRYFRNASNIGAERNIMTVAGYAAANYAWVFGDDDEFEEAAVASAITHIKLGYDLIVLNYSLWSRDLSSELRSRALTAKGVRTFVEPNDVMAFFGIQLGYISCLVARKDILLGASPFEYEPFIQFGFSHLYSTYCGMLSGCRAIYLPDPVFKQREDNSTVFMGEDADQLWCTYFVEGSGVILDRLRMRGYSWLAVLRGKEQVLRCWVAKRILAGVPYASRGYLFRLMLRHYQWNWRFWIVCVPGFLLPQGLLRFAREAYLNLRRQSRVLGFNKG